MEKPVGQRTHVQVGAGPASTRLAEDGDGVGVPTKLSDVRLDPLKGGDKVPQALIARCVRIDLLSLVAEGCEAEGTKPVLGVDGFRQQNDDDDDEDDDGTTHLWLGATMMTSLSAQCMAPYSVHWLEPAVKYLGHMNQMPAVMSFDVVPSKDPHHHWQLVLGTSRLRHINVQVEAVLAPRDPNIVAVRHEAILGAQVQRILGTQVQRIVGARVQGILGARVQRILGARVQRTLGAQVQGILGTRAQRILGARAHRTCGLHLQIPGCTCASRSPIRPTPPPMASPVGARQTWSEKLLNSYWKILQKALLQSRKA